MVKPWAIVAVVAAISAAPVHAQMYKCVDERGVTHYTDKPGPGCKGEDAERQRRAAQLKGDLARQCPF